MNPSFALIVLARFLPIQKLLNALKHPTYSLMISILQIVLLVGYGPSAFDISVDILPVAKEVHVAVKQNPFGVKFENVIYHNMVCTASDYYLP